MSCGPGKIGDWLVPDSPLGLNLNEACLFHDERYTNPFGKSRRQVDRMFLADMLEHAREHKWPWRRSMIAVCVAYYVAVRLGGWMSWYRCRWRDWRRQ